MNFEAEGIVRVRGGIPEDEVARMRGLIDAHIEAKDKTTGFPPMGGAVPAPVAAVIDEVLGTWDTHTQWGVPLVTLPSPGEWDVPHAQWHLDFPVRGEVLPGVRLLGILSLLEPRGGGTLVVTGSHRLALPGRSADVRKVLARRVPWFHDLVSAGGSDRVRRLMEEGTTVDGVTLQVVELTGNAGDVFVMHPWCFHAPSPNTRQVPRMMVSQSVMRT